MVCEWGMSEAMGPLTFGKKEEQIFLGREIAQHQDYSEDTAVKIDGEVRQIVQENYTRAQDQLTRHKEALLKIADELLTREVLDGAQVKAIVQGEALEALPAAASATAEVPGAAPQAPAQGAEKAVEVVPAPLPDPLPQRH
jgi:cell division protease FtsH